MYIAYGLFITHPIWRSSMYMLEPTDCTYETMFSLYLACGHPPQQQSAHPSGTDFLWQSFLLSPKSSG